MCSDSCHLVQSSPLNTLKHGGGNGGAGGGGGLEDEEI
jgi:hypothetical protein